MKNKEPTPKQSSERLSNILKDIEEQEAKDERDSRHKKFIGKKTKIKYVRG